ncbi:MAG TPA: sigma-70 family RNA polymerase sigma factor [Acidobacteriota bacterium]|jgi:RNA polymerase sigma-70 factor (ECF subfamily)|nr:sigma-70 family RNA polymerase sigma factor [Acidobacteriota bacterium]HNT16674.1 sigma-70 family RNA polymerase sigma factor [Acidobacteriota bacterium]
MEKATRKSSGKEESFEKAVLSNMPFLKNTAFKLTRHVEDGEDLLQETLLRAYRFFDHYEPGTHPKAWLYRIMKNTYINSYRKSKREPMSKNGEDVELFSSADSFTGSRLMLDPQRAYSNRDLLEKINSALLRLPSEFKEAVVLCLVDGYSYKEVAGRMGCPIGTIMSRIHRARKLIQRDLGDVSSGISDPVFSCPASFADDLEREETAV